MVNFNKKTYFYIILLFIFLIAIVLRLKTFLIGRPLWHDECSLSLSIVDRTFGGIFLPLEQSQKAPIGFMLISKLVTSILGIKEFSLRLLPFLSGIVSILIFYLFSKKILYSK